MKRNLIVIDEEKCNGCGNCIIGCQEGALALVNGKARLIRESFCDGLGACLPACPTGALTIEEREADAFVEPSPGSPAGREAQTTGAESPLSEKPFFRGCPGHAQQTFSRTQTAASQASLTEKSLPAAPAVVSELRQWPVQIKLLPVQASFYQDARLLIAADCAAYARANFHAEFMKGKITLIGCPKLDAVDYSEKLTEIFRQNDIRSVTVVRMEVPCCGGLETAVKKALQQSGKIIPWQVVTLTTDGQLRED